MMMRKLFLATAAFSMTAAPVAAQEAPRQASSVEASENLAGLGFPGTDGAVLGVMAAVLLLVVLFGNDIFGDDRIVDVPVSP